MSRTRASSRCSRQSRQQRLERSLLGDRQVGPVRVGRVEQDVEVAHRPESRGDLAQAVADSASSARPGTTHRRRARRLAAGGSRRASRGAPRDPSPSRVPASRASIRARWKRMTLRPASAMWSSAVTPGVLPTTRRVVGRRAVLDGLADDVRRGRRDGTVFRGWLGRVGEPRLRPCRGLAGCLAHAGLAARLGSSLGARPASAPPGRSASQSRRRPLDRDPVSRGAAVPVAILRARPDSSARPNGPRPAPPRACSRWPARGPDPRRRPRPAARAAPRRP